MNSNILLLLSTFLSCIVFIISANSPIRLITINDIRHPKNSIPSFETISDISTLKKTFFSYLLPQIQEHNNEIMHLRNQLMQNMISPVEITKLEKKYKASKKDLLERIDIIPPSLILSQAAIESNWGRSRFAKYNNFFGVWCFIKGCGIVPKNRDEGASHEVAIFSSVNDSLKYYVLILNSHSAYQKLRVLRAQARANNQILSGTTLAAGLISYSGIGDEYITTIQKVIKYNNLSIYDTQ